MRSSEVASIAGVSVRTLRHYHALGILPEPERGPNGYRCYDAFDVARVLRIKRLASLGFSLADIGAMLDDGDGGGEPGGQGAAGAVEAEALAQLDRELALQIQHLQEQRRIIAQLQQEQLDPTLPVRFARVVKRLDVQAAAEGVAPAGERDYDRAALAIAAHLYRDQDIAELERFADSVEQLGLLPELGALEERIANLQPNAPEAERAALVKDAMAAMGPLLPCFDAANWQDDGDDASTALFDALSDAALNEAQADVERRIEEAICAAITKASEEGC